MGKLLASISGKITASAPSGLLDGDVEIHADGGVTIDFTGTVDIDAQVNPSLSPSTASSTVAKSRLRFRAYLANGEVLFEPWDIQGGRYEASIDGGEAWSFQLPSTYRASSNAKWQRGVMGYEVDWGGPPPGRGAVGADIVFVDATGAEVVVPVMRGGVSKKSGRNFPTAEEASVLKLTGQGELARYANKTVVYQLGPGHGKTQGEIIRELAALGGVPASKIGVSSSLGSPRKRALDVVKERWLSVAEEAALSAGHRLLWLGDELTTVPVVPRPGGGGSKWAFTKGQIIAGSVSEISDDADIAVCASFQGEEPKPMDEIGDGVEVIETVAEVWRDNYTPGSAAFVQTLVFTTGGLDPISSPFLPIGRALVSATVTRKYLRHGCEIGTDVIEYGYHNPEAARYTLNTDGTKTEVAGVYIYDSSATVGGSEKAYQWQTDKFVEKRRTEIRRFFNSGDGFYAIYRPENAKLLEFVTERKYGWYVRKAAVKQRFGHWQLFEDNDYISGRYVLGNGAGVVSKYAEQYTGARSGYSSRGSGYKFSFFVSDAGSVDLGGTAGEQLGAKIDIFFINEDGMIERIESSSFEPSITLFEGGNFLFSDGSVSGSEFEDMPTSAAGVVPYRIYEFAAGLRYGSTSFESTSYVASRGRVIENKLISRLNEDDISEVKMYDGHLPAAERCDSEDQGRDNARPFCVNVCLTGFVSWADPIDLRNDFIENEDEAITFCLDTLIAGKAPRVTFRTPANPLVRPGSPASFRWPELGLYHDAMVESVVHELMADGTSESEIRLMLALESD